MVSNCPAFCAQDVAEHTIGLMLHATRLASSAERDIRQGIYNPTTYKGKQLKGTKLGLIGYGSIGKIVAQIAQDAFRMSISFVNTKTSRTQFEKVLTDSDVIIITLPLNNSTNRIIGNKEFALMKQGVIVINTGRGAVIDENALIEALKSGKIFTAGLDVLSQEPMDKNNPLFTFPNVTITPHIAFNTESSRVNRSKMATDNIIAFLVGKPQNVVVNNLI